MTTQTVTTAQTLIALASPHKVLKHTIEYSQSLTIQPDGTFTAWYDDYNNDIRTVVRYRGGHTHYNVATIRDYNPEKHAWTRDCGEVEVEMADRRGQSTCRKLHLQLSTAQGHLYPGKSPVWLYRNADGTWK